MNRNRWIGLDWMLKVCSVSASRIWVLSPLLVYGGVSAACLSKGRKNGAQEQSLAEKTGCMREAVRSPGASLSPKKAYALPEVRPCTPPHYEEEPAVFFPENQPDFWLEVDLDKQLRWLHKSFEIEFRLHAYGSDLDSAVQTVLKQQNELLEKLDRMGFSRSQWKISPVERGSLPAPALTTIPALPAPAAATKPNHELPAHPPAPQAEQPLGAPSKELVGAKTLEAPPALVGSALPTRFYAEASVQGQLTQIERIPEFFDLAQERGIRLDLRENLKETAGLDYEEVEICLSRERAWSLLTEQLLRLLQSMGLELKLVDEVRFGAPLKVQNPTPWKHLFNEFKGRWNGFNPESKYELNPELLERMCLIYKVPLHFRVKVGAASHSKLKREQERKGNIALDLQEYSHEEAAFEEEEPEA